MAGTGKGDRLLMGIDVGTSGVKVGVFSPDGTMVGFGRASNYTSCSPRPGWSQSNPELWLEGISHGIGQCCATAGIDPADVDAVGVSVFSPTIVPVDERGKACYPAILYNDQRSVRQVDSILRLIPRDRYQQITGNVLFPGNCAVTSIAWVRDEEPEVYRKTACFAFANTYVTSWLTGRCFTDPTMVSMSGLADIRNPRIWSEHLCTTLNIDASRLPGISESWEVIGVVCAEASAQTGLPKGVPVVNGCVDVVASSVGAGALEEGSLVYVAGSSDNLTTPLSRYAEALNWVQVAYFPENRWMGVGTSTSSGSAVDWFIKEMLGCQDRGYESLHDLVASSEPGSRGVLFLPYLQGERTPLWDPGARGLFIGLSNSTTSGDLARAVFEGTALALRDILESLNELDLSPGKEIRCVGGGIKNPLWNQIKADVLQVPFHILEFQETGCLGAALLAGMGRGVYASFEEAVEVARNRIHVHIVEPDTSRKDLYERSFQIFREAYATSRNIMHALAAGPDVPAAGQAIPHD
jgi:xylulokinase